MVLAIGFYLAGCGDTSSSGNNYYKVKAVNSAGESDYSDSASRNFDPYAYKPGTSTLPGSKSGADLKLTWSFPTARGNEKPYSIVVRIYDPETEKTLDLETLSDTATTYIISSTVWDSCLNEIGRVEMGIYGKNSYGDGDLRSISHHKSSDKWY
jgi:hypothetical protein